MFTVSSLLLNDFFWAPTPLVYASVNKALPQISPFLDYCQLELLNCGKCSPKVDFFLQSTPYGIIYWTESSGLFGGHMAGSMKLTFSRRRKLIVFMAVWDGAPSCCNVQLWRPHVAWITGIKPCRRIIIITIIVTVYFGTWFNERNTSFPHSRHTNWYHYTAAEMVTFLELAFSLFQRNKHDHFEN